MTKEILFGFAFGFWLISQKPQIKNPDLWLLAYFEHFTLKPSAYKHFFNLLKH